MYDHSYRALDDLLRQVVLAHLIEHYEWRPGTVVLTLDGQPVAMSPQHAHRFLCGMLWSTRPA